MLTPDQLAAIEARANAATPGPWRSMVIDADNATVWAGGNTARTSYRIARVDCRAADNVEFVAAAREDVPALLAEVKRLTALLDNAEQQLRYLAELARTADQETAEAYIVHDSITDLITACTRGGEGQ